MADPVEVDISWNMTGLLDGVGSSISSAGSSAWEGVKSASEEGAGAFLGVVMIIVAGLVIWRVAR
jgi:hypothetical protein